MSKLKPGSIASEAARLTVELGIFVTPDKIRWWRKKGYDLHDIPSLKRNLRNQERQPVKKASPPAAEECAFAHRLISDEMISDAKGSIPIAEVLIYLRDQWEAFEWGSEACAARAAGKSESEIDAMIQRHVGSAFWSIHALLPSIDLPPAPDWLRDILFPE